MASSVPGYIIEECYLHLFAVYCPYLADKIVTGHYLYIVAVFAPTYLARLLDFHVDQLLLLWGARWARRFAQQIIIHQAAIIALVAILEYRATVAAFNRRRALWESTA